MRTYRKLLFVAIAAMFLYVCSYYCLVYELTLPGGRPPRQLSAWYRVGGDFSAAIFAPIHALDRKLRPDYWTDYGTTRP